MFWEGFISGFVACILVGIAWRAVTMWQAERQERDAFAASLSVEKQLELQGFLRSGQTWRMFRDLNNAEHVSLSDRLEQIRESERRWHQKPAQSI